MNEPKNLLSPPLADERDAVEVLRVWATPAGPQQVTLRTTWPEPGVWGLLPVDVARHVALAYQNEGRDPAEVLAMIRSLWEAEWLNPTDEPRTVLPEKI
jgi:hypothetical protein